MPKGYIAASYKEAANDDNLSNYAPKALEAIKNAGAKFIARRVPLATFEKGIKQPTVITEFGITVGARAFFTSDAYKAAFALLSDVERDVRVIEGFE